MQVSVIAHNEPWQEFHQNGEMMVGVHGDRVYFKNSDHIMAASHVWVWRKAEQGG